MKLPAAVEPMPSKNQPLLLKVKTNLKAGWTIAPSVPKISKGWESNWLT